jgi:Na+/H+-translocating membrane pyrophosphatase
MSEESENNIGTKAAIAAGAAVGSAAIAAALLFVKRRKSRANEKPPHPEDAPETD